MKKGRQQQDAISKFEKPTKKKEKKENLGSNEWGGIYDISVSYD